MCFWQCDIYLIIKKPIDYTSFTGHHLFQTPKEPPESQNVIKQEFPAKQEKPDLVDNVAVLEPSSISLADSQEAKKTSHHSDTSDISGDEGKDATKENVIDPKHNAQEVEKCVTTSEAVKTSIDTNGNLKNDTQLADYARLLWK